MNKKALIVLWVVLAACNKPAPDGFIVEGDVQGLGNTTLRVFKHIDGGLKIDSIKVINNQFTYTGKVKEPYFVQLMYQSGKSYKKLCEFMLENAEISVYGNTVDFDSIKISGSTADKLLKDYFAEDSRLDAKWDQLKLEYDRYVAAGDTLNRKKTAQQLNHILQVEKNDLVKKYVKNNRDNMVGALIPIFCTVELSGEEYRELYDYLTPEIQQSAYAREILSRANTTE